MSSFSVVQIVVLFSVVAGMSASDHGPIFHTQYGDVRGVYIEEGAFVLGLPFGQPPVGELRWKPPKPFTGSWAPHIRDGSVPGPACPQIGCGPDDEDPQFVCPRDGKLSEDCLYLNIFISRTILTNSTVRLPVLVWFHGGGYDSGTGSALSYDGRFLANKTNTVVMTTNYRLGALGFLVAGEGEDAPTGNYGTMDQIQALKWVQENIGDFGGDKDHVTIFGQSAGSDSVGIHMTYNGSADLFEKGIMSSVPFTIYHKSRADAVRLGNRFAELLNCSAGDVKYYRPVLSVAVTDWVWACPTRNVIRNAIAGGNSDVWLYVFDHVFSIKHTWGNSTCCFTHVCHASDIPIVFQSAPLANLSLTADEQVLADTIAYHYGNFAHTGDPNKPNEHLPRPNLNIPDNLNWPKYNKDNGFPILNMTTPQNILMHDYRKDKCDFWDREDIYT
ncbi:crystal protein-like [Branchiostoma floridae]|uniref:Carboxylic ester hydrolase n=1 Tax=Branchiostoma floridae TaxID=7739 RepID=A0A9J7L0I6_BRAFL|nr:crystal protein-like [Branchiostoma floridae]